MPSARIIVTAIALVLFPLAEVQAQDAAYEKDLQRVCSKEDLTGHAYQMVDFKETPPRGETQWIKSFPYNYLAFYPNNRYVSIALGSQVEDSKKLQSLMGMNFGNTMTYSINQSGILTLLYGSDISFTYRCVEVLKPLDDYRPGDLILKGYTRKRRSEIYKLYRRWY
jgi:hypothetical protein